MIISVDQTSGGAVLALSQRERREVNRQYKVKQTPRDRDAKDETRDLDVYHLRLRFVIDDQLKGVRE
jgi:hypothetical protein